MRQDLLLNKLNKIGEINKTKYGNTMKIISYNNANDINNLIGDENK